MTIADLRALLDDYPDSTEVRLATQPSWPLEHALADRVAEGEGPGVVYLVEGRRLGYLPSEVSAW